MAGRTLRSFVKTPPSAGALSRALKSAPRADAMSAADVTGGMMTPATLMNPQLPTQELPSTSTAMSAAIEKNTKPLGDPSMLSAFVRGAQSFVDTRAARRQQTIQEARDKYAMQIQQELDSFRRAQMAREQSQWGAQDAAAARQQTALGQFTAGMSGQDAAAAMLDPGAAVGAYFTGQKQTVVPAGGDLTQNGRLVYRNPREATPPYMLGAPQTPDDLTFGPKPGGQ